MEQRIDSQCKRILEYLQTNKGITPIEALAMFGCLRLSARIKDLREAGHNIVTDMVTEENEKGETKRYARYFLLETK